MALLEHYWLRPHRGLRERLPEAAPSSGRRYQQRTPAIAIRVADHLWSWEEFLSHPISQYQRE